MPPGIAVKSLPLPRPEFPVFLEGDSLLEAHPLGLRWLMIGFAFAATIINYLDRQILSVVVTSPDFKAAVPLTV